MSPKTFGSLAHDTCVALADLHVNADALASADRQRLDDDGFVALPGIIAPHWLNELRDRVDELSREEGPGAGEDVGGNAGADMLSDLFNKGEVFESMLRQPQVLAGARHVLGDFKVNSLNYRSAPPAGGAQALHSDTGMPGRPGGYEVYNSIWLLDDFTEDDGATRVVAGTHRLGRLSGEDMADPADAHPEEQLLCAPAGTVVIFNAAIQVPEAIRLKVVPSMLTDRL